MDLEELNKTQILLLTLLTSFVTSIATGIVTVSLLEQAPQGVTQTINRVVERTVEKVVPAQAASVITKETTVVVKEDDVVAQSIEKELASIVGIYEQQVLEDLSETPVFVGWGTVVSSNGLIVTDSALVSGTGIYRVRDSKGTMIDVKVVSQDEKLGIALIVATPPKGIALAPVQFGDTGKLKLGQNVIAFGGKEKASIAVGVVSAFAPFERVAAGTTSIETVLGYVDSSIEVPQGSRGGPLITIFGDVVGIRTTHTEARFIGTFLVKEFIERSSKQATSTPTSSQ